MSSNLAVTDSTENQNINLLSYQLQGWPKNLFIPKAKNAPQPIYVYAGMPNRELRKQRLRSLRKLFDIPKGTGDDELVQKWLGAQVPRVRLFWKTKDNFKAIDTPITDYHEAFGLSILHSLIAQYSSSAFAPLPNDRIEILIKEINETGFPIEDICSDLAESNPKEFDRTLLGFLKIWPLLLEHLKQWETLEDNMRDVVANAIFAISAAMNSPEFMNRAVQICPDLEKFYEGFESEEYLISVLEEGGLIIKKQVDAMEEPFQKLSAPSHLPVEVWSSLVKELHDLAARMADAGPTESILEELHDLVGRIDQVPLNPPISLSDVLARLDEVFGRYEAGENAGRFAAIRADIQQIVARWRFLTHEASTGELSELNDDLGRRVAEATPHETAYLEAAKRLSGAIAACEVAQQGLAGAPLAKKSDLRNQLRTREKERDQIDDEVTGCISSLLAALNFKGEAFDINQDWIEKFDALMAGAAVKAPSPDESQLNGQQEVVNEAVALPGASEVSTPISIVVLPNEDKVAQEVGGSVEAGEAQDETETEQTPAIDEQAPIEITRADEISGDQAAVSQFWSLVCFGEYGLAYNLAALSGPSSGLPRPSVMKLLILGTNLAYPQGALARALEETVASFYPTEDLDNLVGTYSLATNLLLVAATLRSSLLAPNTGANDILQQGISLGAGWDKLHELMQCVGNTAHLMHGVFLGPDAFRESKESKIIDAEREALKTEAEAWLNDKSKSRLTFPPATSVWHQWVGKEGFVYKLLTPIFDQDKPLTPEWKDLLGFLADPRDVERKVQESDRALRGSRFGNIDYDALDQIKRRVAEAVHMVRRWMSIEDAQPKSDYIKQNIRELDRRLIALRAPVIEEIQNAKQKPELEIRAVAACLERELDNLYSLFAPEPSVVPVEWPPMLFLNGELLLLSQIHLDAGYQPDSSKGLILEAVLAHQPGSINYSDAAIRKMDEGDYEGAEQLIERASGCAEIDNLNVAGIFVDRIAEARNALKAQYNSTFKKLERGFRSGLISDAERDRMNSILADIEANIKEVRRIDLARNSLREITDQIDASSALRMEELKGRFSKLELEKGNPRYVDIITLIEKGDALAAEEYIDHAARGENPPSSEQAEDESSRFPAFLTSVNGVVSLPDVEMAMRGGTDWNKLLISELPAEARQEAASLLSAWNAVKRLKRTSGEPGFEPGVIGRLLTELGFHLAASSPVTMNSRGSSRLDLSMRTQPLVDRRVCPVPEFGSEAKGQYRVICVYPKAHELEVTEITPAQRGTPAATIVLFMGSLSREGRQKLFRQNLQARRAWLVVDEILVLYLAMQAQGRLRAMFSATIPYTVTDPYRIKQAGIVPPEMFFGRSAEREAIISLQGASFVYGGRQLGKTVLLKEIERLLHEPAADSIVQWVDLPGHGVGRSCRPEALWTILVRELYRYGVVSLDWPEFRANEPRHIARITEDIRNWLGEHPNGRILLLLDEADEFLKEEAAEDYPVTRQLKALMERTNGHFKPVFVGLHNVLRSTRAPNNPLVHLGAVEIGPLYGSGESRAAFEMVRSPFTALGYVFEDDSLILRILAACNYYPNLINLFCRKLLDRLRNRADAVAVDPGRGATIITEKIVSETYEDTALRDEIRHYFLLTLELDTRYELVANWLAMEYLQKNMNSADGELAMNIRAAVQALWPEGFRGTNDHEFDALLMEMVGLGVLRRVNGNHFTFRNPNVLQLMGTATEIDGRLTKIVVEGELKPGFDASTFHGPMTDSAHDPQRSPLTIDQENLICSSTNGILVVCGAPLSDLSKIQKSLKYRHAVSNLFLINAIALDQAENELDAIRGKAKPGINVLVVPETKPWNLDWVVRFHENLKSRVSTSSFVRVVFEIGPILLWNMARDNALDRLTEYNLISLKPWSDPFLWIWLEDINMPPQKSVRKAVLEATDGRPGLIMELHADFDSGPHLNERINSFRNGLLDPERARLIIAGLGVPNDGALKGLSVIKELPGESVEVFEQFWSSMGPDGVSVNAFLRWAELLSLVRPVGQGRWEVEPFVAGLLDAIEL